MADVQLVEISATEGAQIINSTVEAQQPAQIVLAVPGVQGPTGSNLPASGTTHQVLFKQSNTNYDTGWKLITNDNVDGAAAIAGTKISPNFGSQTIQTTGVFSHALGTAGAPTITFTGDVDTGIYSPGADQLALSTNGTGRLFVNSSGQVGIGATPDATLTVDSGATGLIANLNSSAANGGYIVGKSSGTPVWDLGTAKQALNVGGASDFGLNTRSGFLAFGTASLERLRITSDGKVGIGTSSPGALCSLAGSSAYTVGNSGLATQGLDINATAGGSGLFGGALSFGVGGTGRASINAFQGTADNDVVGLVFNVHTSGTALADAVEAMRITQGGLVGIGTSSPVALLQPNGTVSITGGSGASSANGLHLYFDTATNSGTITAFHSGVDNRNLTLDGKTIGFTIAGTEYARIDSSGRLLVGTSSVKTAGDVKQEILNGGLGVSRYANDAFANALVFTKSRGTSNGTIVQFNDQLGPINWLADDGTSTPKSAALIDCYVDGTPGANDMPGRLVFSTTADGAVAPTERMRIDSTGRVSAYLGISAGTTTQDRPPLALSSIGAAYSTGAGTGELIYSPASTVIAINNTTPTTGVGALINFSTTSSVGVCGAYFGAVDGSAINGSAHLVFGRRTGAQSWTETARIDSSGRLLVGTSMARSNYSAYGSAIAQLEGANNDGARALSITYGKADAGGDPIISLGKHRSNSVGGVTAVVADDGLGQIVFAGSDGTNFVTSASIRSYVDGTPGTNDMPGRLVFATTADGASSSTERMRIDSAGRLLVGTDSVVSIGGIGTGTTQAVFQQNAATNVALISTPNSEFGPYLTFAKSRGGTTTSVSNGDALGSLSFVGADGVDFDSVAARIEAYVDGTPGANDMPGRLVFSTTADGASSPTERMRITSGGVLRTFSSDGNTLDLVSNKTAGTTDNLVLGRYSGTGVDTGTASFAVRTNGDVVNTNNSYGAISDVKLKENIVDATSQWSDIKALQVRKYNFKEGQTHTQIGLVAQEVELVSPGLVTESPDRDKDGNDLGTVTKSVNYSVLYMKAVKALQEAMERIETLEAKVAALESA